MHRFYLSKFALWLLLAVSTLALPIAAQYPVTIVDDRGKQIIVNRKPQRLVVAGIPLYTEIIIDFGAGNRLVAVPTSPANPLSVTRLPKIGRALAPNLEIIVQLRPDIVFGAFGHVRNAIEKMGITVITIGGAGAGLNKLADIFTGMRAIDMAIFGNSKRADAWTKKIRGQITTFQNLLATREKVAVAILYPRKNQPPLVAGSNTPENEILSYSGATNVFADIDKYQQASLEQLLKRNPQMVIIDPAHESLLNNPLLQQLPAVTDGKIVMIPAVQWTSLRIATTMRTLITKLHPTIHLD